MAHRISHANGRAEIAYAGETPWHGLGVKVDGLQTVAAMLAAAGLEWRVELRDLYRQDLHGVAGGMIAVDGFKAIVRADLDILLSVVTDRYMPIQNGQAGEMMDALVTEGGAHVEVAGALDQGERCWMLAHIPADFEVVKGDRVKLYMLLCWGHDGKHGLAGKLTGVRVVCHNTLTAAGFGDGAKWSNVADVYVRHSKNATLRIEEARKALGLIRKQADSTKVAYQALAARALSGQEVKAYIEAVFPYAKVSAGLEGEPDTATVDRLMGQTSSSQELRRQIEEARQRVDETRDVIARLMGEGMGANLAPGTAWAAYNAVTEWTDHVYPVLQSGEVSKVRTQSVMFGSYADTKRRALGEALSLVGA